MDQAETIEVMGMTLTRVTKAHGGVDLRRQRKAGDDADAVPLARPVACARGAWSTGPAATVRIHAYDVRPGCGARAAGHDAATDAAARRSGATWLRCWTRARWRRE